MRGAAAAAASVAAASRLASLAYMRLRSCVRAGPAAALRRARARALPGMAAALASFSRAMRGRARGRVEHESALVAAQP